MIKIQFLIFSRHESYHIKQFLKCIDFFRLIHMIFKYLSSYEFGYWRLDLIILCKKKLKM